MFEMPTIQQIENFVLYGKFKNFTLAAHAANITQSAFSAQIKKLEENIGVQLIVRDRRGSDFTEAGEKFFVEVSGWLEGLHTIINDVQLHSGHAKVNLKVGVLISFGDILMNQHVAHFQQGNQDICIEVYDMDEETLLSSLKRHYIDIASVYRMPHLPSTDYRSICFCEDEMVYYAPLILRRKKIVTLADVVSVPFIGYPEKYAINQSFQGYFLRNGQFPRVIARLSSPYAIIHYCLNNRVGTFLPKRLLKTLGIMNGWVTLTPSLSLDACLLYKINNPKMDTLRTYIDYILTINNRKSDRIGAV